MIFTPWKESYDQPRKHIKKQRHYFANKACLVKGYINKVLFLSAFKIFPQVFKCTYISGHEFLWIYSVCDLLSFLISWVNIFCHFGEFFQLLFECFPILPFSFSPETLITWVLDPIYSFTEAQIFCYLCSFFLFSCSNCMISVVLSSFQFSHSVMSDSLQTHGLQHARPPCPSPTPAVYSNSCPLSQLCHPTILYSVIPFSSHLQFFPASGSYQMSQFFASGGQNIGVSALASVLPMNIHDWFPLGLTGWISLQSKFLSAHFFISSTLLRLLKNIIKHVYDYLFLWWVI